MVMTEQEFAQECAKYGFTLSAPRRQSGAYEAVGGRYDRFVLRWSPDEPESAQWYMHDGVVQLAGSGATLPAAMKTLTTKLIACARAYNGNFEDTLSILEGWQRIAEAEALANVPFDLKTFDLGAPWERMHPHQWRWGSYRLQICVDPLENMYNSVYLDLVPARENSTYMMTMNAIPLSPVSKDVTVLDVHKAIEELWASLPPKPVITVAKDG